MGSNPIGSIALLYGHLAGPCPTTRHGFKPAERAARCRSCKFRQSPYWAPPAALIFGSHGPQVCPWFAQSQPEPLTTLDLLGLSPIAAGLAQFLTYCAVAALWAVAVADWLTADQPRQIRLLASCGHSQASISRRLGVSRYAVRKVLA